MVTRMVLTAALTAAALAAVTPQCEGAEKTRPKRQAPAPAPREVQGTGGAELLAAHSTAVRREVGMPSAWWIGGGVLGGIRPGQLYGGTISGGYRPGNLGFDLSFSGVSARFGAIFLYPNSSELSAAGGYPSYYEPQSEMNRVRDRADAWTVLLAEPGLSASGRLFPDLLPLLTQTARFGIGVGRLTDRVNSLAFSALQASFKASLRQRLGSESPWHLDLGFGITWGRMATSREGETQQLRRLPFAFLAGTLLVVYSPH